MHLDYNRTTDRTRVGDWVATTRDLGDEKTDGLVKCHDVHELVARLRRGAVPCLRGLSVRGGVHASDVRASCGLDLASERNQRGGAHIGVDDVEKRAGVGDEVVCRRARDARPRD